MGQWEEFNDLQQQGRNVVKSTEIVHILGHIPLKAKSEIGTHVPVLYWECTQKKGGEGSMERSKNMIYMEFSFILIP